MQTPDNEDSDPDFNSGAKDYTKYAGIGVKMVVIIVFGVFLGEYLDKIYVFGDFPVFTIMLSLISVSFAMYISVKDLLR